MAIAEPETARRGGRAARRAARAAPLPETERPVRPGLEGGRYRPLDAADPIKIHRARLRVQEMLAGRHPAHLPRAVDEAIRARLPVRLPASAMQPGA